jgi:hypothetical protein
MAEPLATTSGKAITLVIAVSALAMLVALLLISVLNGPTEDGLRCTRNGGSPGECQVLRTRFFGLFGNTAIPIPESDIRGAKAVCATSRVGRASASCNVYVVDARGGYLVLSYPLQPEADAAAARINAYLADGTRPAFEMRESVRSVLLLRLAIPALLVGLVLGMRVWRLRRRAEAR